MKCDHLIGRKFDGEVYILASDVMEAVAELKANLQEEREFGLNRAKSADHEIGKMCAEIAELQEERRWRKFSDEKPPKYTWCLVSGKSQMGNYIVITDFFEEDDWAENPNLDDDTLDIEWWMPLPSAPKEADK